MEKTVRFRLNGQPRTVTTEAERPLIEVLREEFRLTGTKHGCGEGACGACTVLVDGRSVVSCITPIERLEGTSIVTIEGLASDGKLHPVQEAFLAENAFQCGYCTPGMILAVAGMLEERPRPSEADILVRMETHLCRCCGYARIVKAIRRAHATAPG